VFDGSFINWTFNLFVLFNDAHYLKLHGFKWEEDWQIIKDMEGSGHGRLEVMFWIFVEGLSETM
jgi:hypothetical protein